jgi:hypothetical protein
LDDVWDSFHFDALGLVDVLEGVELASLFVLDDTDLGNGSAGGMRGCMGTADFAKSTLSDAAEEDKVEEGDFAIKVNGLERTMRTGKAETSWRQTWGLQQTAPMGKS